VRARSAARETLALCAAALLPAVAHPTVYPLGDGRAAVFGSVDRIPAKHEDTFVDLARRFSLGYEEIRRVNPGVDPWLPGEGTAVLLPNRRLLPPGPREGIVVNLPEHRLYFYPKPKKGEQPVVITYPVSVGKMDWRTPLGQTRIVAKQKDPSWFPPESVRKEHAARGEPLPRVVPPGPDNPLGAHAMRLGISPGSYLIHGTNNPAAVGLPVTHGCIRMYPEDVAALFPLVPVGTPVWLINEPVKVAWVDGELILEVHPPIDAEGQTIEPNLEDFSRRLDEALGPITAAINWDLAIDTLSQATGMPVTVGVRASLDYPPEMAEEPFTASASP
jgi:L,D-transpeptidase ErfK/SrfK